MPSERVKRNIGTKRGKNQSSCVFYVKRWDFQVHCAKRSIACSGSIAKSIQAQAEMSRFEVAAIARIGFVFARRLVSLANSRAPQKSRARARAVSGW